MCVDELREECGKGKDLGGRREKVFKRADSGYPIPSLLQGSRGQPRLSPGTWLIFFRFLGLMPRKRKQPPGMVRVLGDCASLAC